MSENINLLADAYCDLIEAKLPIKSKQQHRYLNEIHRIITDRINASDCSIGLKDLYEIYGRPAEIAERLSAIMSDPENTDNSIADILDNGHAPGKSGSNEPHIDKAINVTQDGSDDKRRERLAKQMSDIIDKLEKADIMDKAGMSVAQISLLTEIPTFALYLHGFGEPENDMSEYIIPVKFEMQGFVKVKATSVDDAAMTADIFGDLPIPEHADFVPGSVKICTDHNMISMFTDKYRQGKLELIPEESGIMSPIADRDNIIAKSNPDILLDTDELHKYLYKNDHRYHYEPDDSDEDSH